MNPSTSNSTAPHTDLLTYVFGNVQVSEEQPILMDAEIQMQILQGDTESHKNEQQELGTRQSWQRECGRLTKGELRVLVRRLVAGFRRLSGGRRGFVVCLHSFNHIIYPALFLAVIGAGGQWTGSNPAYTAGELAHHLRVSKADFLFTGLESLDVAAAATEECSISSDKIFILNTPSQAIPPALQCWTDLLHHGESDWDTFDDERTSKQTIAGLFSTSGTTGLPKMAARSHYSFVAENFALQDPRQKHYDVQRLISIPFFHAFASAIVLVSALHDGRTTYIMRRFSRQTFLDAVSHFRITETAMVPPLLVELLKYPPADQVKLRSLELVWCAGSPLDPGVQAQACRMFSRTSRIVQVWGMTECGWISTFPYPENDTTGSVGRLLPGFEAKLISDAGVTISRSDQSGEMCVRSPMVMNGYIGDDKATRDTIDEQGWLHTGDIGFIRQNKMYIVDRKKELIKVRGWQIAPAELEGTLLMHPSIADAAVIGVPRPGQTLAGEEIPRAYVVLAPATAITTPITEQEVRTFLLKHLARYKVGECEIRFRKDIPKSASGKILRKLLRAELTMEDDLSRWQSPVMPVLQPIPSATAITATTTIDIEREAYSKHTPELLVASAQYSEKQHNDLGTDSHSTTSCIYTSADDRVLSPVITLFRTIWRWLALGIGLGAGIGFGTAAIDSVTTASLRHVIVDGLMGSSVRWAGELVGLR